MDLNYFNTSNFNVLEDYKFFYFFRALNNSDNSQILDGTITDENGNIIRINTDLSRFEDESKYEIDSKITLEEMVDHIKMHYRKDTKCISLSSNANVSLTYGRGYYNDNYVIVKVKKEDIGKTVYNAPLYMINEINKRLDAIIEDENIDISLIERINNAKTSEELSLFNENVEQSNNSKFEKGINYIKSIDTTVDYQTLDEEQNLEKNKLIAKINIIHSNIIPNMSNKFLIQTIGNALSSLELIHYDTINKEEIINIPKEIIDIISITQQLPQEVSLVKRLKNEIIDYINKGDFSEIKGFDYEDRFIENDLSIENVYNLTNGRYSYNDINTYYNKAFYIVKSKLRCKSIIKNIKNITLNDPDYLGIENYIQNNCYAIEPEIVFRQNNKGFKLSESVNLDINIKEYSGLEKIISLNSEQLQSIIENPLNSLEYINRPKERSMSKEDYYANAIIDLFDFKKLGIESLDEEKKLDIVNKLKEHDIISLYNKLKAKGIKEKDISNVLLTCLIKGKEIDELDIKDTFTVSELEEFVGYYRIKGTTLKLRDYQANALENIDDGLDINRFVAAILPTGAGKSYIALSKMLDYKDKKIIYLAPNDEILNQMKRLIRDTMYGKEMRKSLDSIVKEIFPNLTLTTYQSLLSNNNELINSNYDFIVFDEMHRTGASIWNEKVNSLINNQRDNTKYLGITATPLRDADLVNMANSLAKKLGYNDNQIGNNEHLAYNLDLVSAIKAGYVMNPKVIQCEYNLLHDGSLEKMLEKINGINDLEKKNYYLNKFEILRRSLNDASGISDIIGSNISEGGKYIVFIPVNRRDNGTYEDLDGNVISKNKAQHIVKMYKNLMNQYMFTYKYTKENGIILNEIHNKISNNISLTKKELNWINNEKENILLLSKIKSNVIKEDNNVITKENDMADTIIRYMNFKKLDEAKKGSLLSEKTKEYVENYSMLGSYGMKHNNRELISFENDNSNKYKFMIVMNKLNEGTHIKGVNGLIWFRALDENSKILFLQQFGRIIYGLDPNREYTNEDRTIAIDLVNNILRVNIHKGEKKQQDDLELLRNIIEWCKIHNIYLPNINSSDKIESNYASILKRIKEAYNKYLDKDELNKLDIDEKNKIISILNLGYTIDLWNIIFDKKIKNPKDDKNDIEIFEELFELSPILKDYVELEVELNNTTKNTFEDNLKEVADYLKENLKITNYKKAKYKMKTKNSLVSSFLIVNKETIINIANYNENALYICKHFNWLRKQSSFEESLEEIVNYLNKSEKKLSYSKINERMKTRATTIGQYLFRQKDKIISMRKENKYAFYICEYFKWSDINYKYDDSLKEVSKYLKDNPSIQTITSTRKNNEKMYTTPISINSFLEKEKNNIIYLSDSNSDAYYICDRFGWLKQKYSFEENLKEIVVFLKKNEVTAFGNIKERMKTRDAYIGIFLSNNKNKIIELSQSNNDALFICNYFGWLNVKYSFEDQIKDVCDYLKNNPGITNYGKIQERMKTRDSSIGSFLSEYKKNILGLIDTNSDALYIANYFKWNDKIYSFDECLKEICEYLILNPTIVNSRHIEKRMITRNTTISTFFKHKKNDIVKIYDKNEYAYYICNRFKWIKHDYSIEDNINEAATYLRNNQSVDSLYTDLKMKTTNATYRSFVKHHKEDILRLSKTNNEALYICERLNWSYMCYSIEDNINEVACYLKNSNDIQGYQRIKQKMKTRNSLIGSFLKNKKNKIIELSKSNEDALYICNYFNWIIYSDKDESIYIDNSKNYIKVL